MDGGKRETSYFFLKIGDKMEWIFIDGKQIPLDEYIGDIDDD